jgi:hypothetical protein
MTAQILLLYGLNLKSEPLKLIECLRFHCPLPRKLAFDIR